MGVNAAFTRAKKVPALEAHEANVLAHLRRGVGAAALFAAVVDTLS